MIGNYHFYFSKKLALKFHLPASLLICRLFNLTENMNEQQTYIDFPNNKNIG